MAAPTPTPPTCVARALKPHGGLLFYRGFVYDHHADWTNPKNDRGRAAYDNFQPLDGKFDDNVIVQIKHGPIDFQVREPASPLFGALEKTNQAIELQITQEYFGQARHTVFLVPMWKAAARFRHARRAMAPTPVKALVAGKTFHRPTGGFVGVSNVGLDDNWYGNHLSQANLYGFGRLAWNPDLSAQQIIDEWTRLTFGTDPKTVETINSIQLTSWRTYENYTGPLGLQTLTDIVGNHYGVTVEASERNGWGQWHNADEKGVGMERTVAKGTGYIGQYRPAVAKVYESLRDLSRRFAALPAPRSVHLQAAFRQDRDPVHLRLALRRRGRRCRVGAPVEVAARAASTTSATTEVLAQLEYQAGTGRGLARCRQRLVPPHLRHRRRQGSRGPSPRPHRSRGHEARRLHRARRHPVGDRVRRQGDRLPSREMHRRAALRWCRPAGTPSTSNTSTSSTPSRASAVGRPPTGRRMDRCRPPARAQTRFLIFHPPCRLRNRSTPRRPDSHRRHSRRPANPPPSTTSRSCPMHKSRRSRSNTTVLSLTPS